MSKDGYRYILRFTLEPSVWRQRKDALLKYCEAAKIDDVMFFTNPGELNTGHSTLSEIEYWMEGIAGVQGPLAEIGVTTSINPWATIGQSNYGRDLKQEQNFQRMVDMDGNIAMMTACFLCPEWRESIVGIMKLLATIKPSMIWLDDDFRFHNHRPLHWGGCFCDLHMRGFSERAGKELTREEFVKGLTDVGTPHPYRKIWLDHCADTVVETASIFTLAVHSVSPSTVMAQMTSHPAVHCVEGRDWNRLFDALSDNIGTADRICLGHYREAGLQDFSWQINSLSRHLAAAIPTTVDVLPELENVPYTYFSKSETFAKLQIESSMIIGASGVTMNLFEFNGNGILRYNDYASMLSDIKPRLNEIMKHITKVNEHIGVKALFDPRSSYTIHNTDEGEIGGLTPMGEYFWAPYLSSMGFAVAPTVSREDGGVYAIGGQYFRNLTEVEINKLLNDNVCILEAEAVMTLCDMGLGHLLGVKDAKVKRTEKAFACYEQSRVPLCGIDEARMRATQNTPIGEFVEIYYSTPPEIITDVYNYYREPVAVGTCIVNDRILILPHIPHSGPSTLLMPQRQQIVLDFLRKHSPENLTAVLNKAYVTCVLSPCGENSRMITLLNISCDSHSLLEIEAPWLAGKDVKISGIYDNAELIGVENNIIKIKLELPYMSVRMLKIEW